MKPEIIAVDAIVVALLAMCAVWGALLAWACGKLAAERVGRRRRARRLVAGCVRCELRCSDRERP